jgi:hypothetical protein
LAIKPREARVIALIHGSLQAAIAAHQLQRIVDIGSIVDTAHRVHQMDAGDIALAPFRRHQAGRAANRQHFRGHPLARQQSNEVVKADAMAADDHEIRRLRRRADDRHRDLHARRHHFSLRRNGEEAVRQGEGRYCPGTLADGVGCEPGFRPFRQRHQDIFGPTEF